MITMNTDLTAIQYAAGQTLQNLVNATKPGISAETVRICAQYVQQTRDAVITSIDDTLKNFKLPVKLKKAFTKAKRALKESRTVIDFLSELEDGMYYLGALRCAVDKNREAEFFYTISFNEDFKCPDGYGWLFWVCTYENGERVCSDHGETYELKQDLTHSPIYLNLIELQNKLGIDPNLE